MADTLDRHPSGQTPPPGRHPLPPTATAADGMHPTAMPSCQKWVLTVIELFIIDLDAKELVHYGRVLIASELVVSGTQCI